MRTVRIPDGPLRFAVACPYCLQVLDVIPVDGDDWHAAAAFAYLAAAGHRRECPKRATPPTG